MSKNNGLVYGAGINDTDYTTQVQVTVGYREDGKQIRKLVWACPFYTAWTHMLERCYSSKYQEKRPTYVGCTVVEEWKTFSKFKAWMEKQDWEGKQLDKDLLVHSNKVYGPEHCVFVSRQINVFMIERTASRGEWPIGVYWDKGKKKFRACCNNPFTKKREKLGYFTCPNEAHNAWLKRKREHAKALANLQTDRRVSNALIDRYNVDTYNQLHEVLNVRC